MKFGVEMAKLKKKLETRGKKLKLSEDLSTPSLQTSV